MKFSAILFALFLVASEAATLRKPDGLGMLPDEEHTSRNLQTARQDPNDGVEVSPKEPMEQRPKEPKEQPPKEQREQMKILESEPCKPLMEAVGKKVANLVEVGKKEATNYMCNPIVRKEMMDEVKEMEEDELNERRLQTADLTAGLNEEQKECVRAFEGAMVANKDSIKRAAKAKGSCKREVDKELEAVTEVVNDAKRRILAAQGDDRELVVFTGAAIATIAAGALVAGGSVVAAAIGGLGSFIGAIKWW